MTLVLALLVAMGCSDEIEDIPEDTKPVADTEASSGSAEAKALYEQCRVRVEGAEKADECKTDADCVAAGCSKEVCIPKEVAGAGLTTPCDVEPCFAVLDSCGCVSGTCSWSVKDTVPAGATKAPTKGPRRLE